MHLSSDKYTKGDVAREKVDVIKVDTFCKKNKIDQIDIFKSDIQGNELNGLKSAKKLLKKGNIVVVFIETNFENQYVNQGEYYEIYEYLSKFGYTLYGFYDQVYSGENGELSWADTMFISPKLVKLLKGK